MPSSISPSSRSDRRWTGNDSDSNSSAVSGHPLSDSTTKEQCEASSQTTQASTPPSSTSGDHSTHHIVWSFDSLFCEYETDWANPPQISGVRAVLGPFLDRLDLGADPQIDFLGDGSYHKVFGVRRRHDQLSADASSPKAHPGFVFRVALPVYPFCKTASEVATMTYVRQHTDIPIPQVHAYDASSQNALGHEWILMDMVDGASTYSQVEETLDVNQKLKVAQQLADCVHKLDQLRFSSVGSLYFEDDLHQIPQARSFATASASHTHGLPGRGPVFIDPEYDASICLGPAISGVFFGDWRNEYEFDRGPYPTVEAFIKGALEMHRLETIDHRQRARSDMYAAVDAAWGDPEEDKIAREERLACVRAEWMEMTKAKLGGSLDPCVDWVNDAPWFIKEDRLNEFDDATRAALHLTLALEGDDFAMAREDLTANPVSCRLHHWDLAGRNILIDDETGDLRALLDWEQIISLPPYLCGFYPRALLGRGPDRANDELLEPTRPADDAMEDEDEFHTQMGDYTAKLLRDEFRHRLDSLDHAWSDFYAARRDDFQPRSPEGLSDSDTDSVRDNVAALTPLQRARGAQAAIRRTINFLNLPMHHAWRNIYELYEYLDYSDS